MTWLVERSWLLVVLALLIGFGSTWWWMVRRISSRVPIYGAVEKPVTNNARVPEAGEPHARDTGRAQGPAVGTTATPLPVVPTSSRPYADDRMTVGGAAGLAGAMGAASRRQADSEVERVGSDGSAGEGGEASAAAGAGVGLSLSKVSSDSVVEHASESAPVAAHEMPAVGSISLGKRTEHDSEGGGGKTTGDSAPGPAANAAGDGHHDARGASASPRISLGKLAAEAVPSGIALGKVATPTTEVDRSAATVTTSTHAVGSFGEGSVDPLSDGSMPVGFDIKGNADSMLYHSPESPWYGRTKAEVWFRDEATAEAAGFKHWDPAKR